MRSLLKLAALLSLGFMPMAVRAEKEADPSGAVAEKKEGTKKKGEKSKEKKAKPDKNAEANVPAKEAVKPAMDVPVPQGHDAKGLKIPYFDTEGKLQMTFTIGVASRLDDEHIQMASLQIETFASSGEPEMAIDLPSAVLNLTTSVISTKKHVEIRRDDFELTGETMEFNTKTKQGALGGGVRMLIYNLTNEMPETPTPEPAAAATLKTP